MTTTLEALIQQARDEAAAQDLIHLDTTLFRHHMGDEVVDLLAQAHAGNTPLDFDYEGRSLFVTYLYPGRRDLNVLTLTDTQTRRVVASWVVTEDDPAIRSAFLRTLGALAMGEL